MHGNPHYITICRVLQLHLHTGVEINQSTHSHICVGHRHHIRLAHHVVAVAKSGQTTLQVVQYKDHFSPLNCIVHCQPPDEQTGLFLGQASTCETNRINSSNVTQMSAFECRGLHMCKTCKSHDKHMPQLPVSQGNTHKIQEWCEKHSIKAE